MHLTFQSIDIMSPGGHNSKMYSLYTETHKQRIPRINTTVTVLHMSLILLLVNSKIHIFVLFLLFHCPYFSKDLNLIYLVFLKITQNNCFKIFWITPIIIFLCHCIFQRRSFLYIWFRPSLRRGKFLP